MWTTPAGVCEGRYCKRWLPWSPWHSLPPCCGRRQRRRVTISYSTVGGIELSDTVWGWTLSTLRLLWQYVLPAKSIFSAVFWLREKFRSLLQIYEAVLASAAQKSRLSAPPGKYLGCYTHPHYFSATPYWAADWEELHVFPSKPKLLDW